MARKKVARKAKKTIRNQAKIVTTISVEAMEKSFKNTPKQIVAQCQKELATLRQQEKKLVAELNKARSLTEEIKEKCASLTNSNSSARAKKQLASAKKGLVSANAAVKEMTTKYSQLTKQINSLADSQGKYAALSKELSKFDTQWTKAVKKAAAEKKAAEAAKLAAKEAKKAAKKAQKAAKKHTTTVSEEISDMEETSAAPQEEYQEEIESTESDSVEVVS